MRLKRGAKCVGRVVSIMKPRVSVNRSKKGSSSSFFQRRVNKKLSLIIVDYRDVLYFRRPLGNVLDRSGQGGRTDERTARRRRTCA